MREILREIKRLQYKDRGCMPNLRGASLVRPSYATRTVSRGRPNWRRHDRGGVLGAGVMIGMQAHRQDAWTHGQGVRLRGQGAGPVGKVSGHAGKAHERGQDAQAHGQGVRSSGQGVRTRKQGVRTRKQGARVRGRAGSRGLGQDEGS